jgi:hypothetical protein
MLPFARGNVNGGPLCSLVPREKLREKADAALRVLMQEASPQVQQCVRQIEPDPHKLTRIALDQHAAYAGPVFEPPYLEYITRENDTVAWEYLRYATTTESSSVAVATRLCRLYDCRLDTAGLFGFAEWARREGGIDLSKPLAPPARQKQ